MGLSPDWHLPGGSETPSKPVGTVFLSLLFKNKLYRRKKMFTGGPHEIRLKAAEAMYEMIADIVT
jgi:nicotinamide mononucleotide (NMN) deamidase PncC